jgi:uncharacterized repeat protein (TIGR03803 family)
VGGAEASSSGLLIQGTDGNFYGTSEIGGAFDKGTVFMMTPGGAVTTLYSFAGGADGRGPKAPLVQATDGDFYGTAPGGAFNQGVVFRVTGSGDFAVLHTFSGGPADGAQPQSRLLQAADGTFYGTTTSGGAVGLGTVFTLTPSGSFALLHSFGTTIGAAAARAPVLESSDGNFMAPAGLGPPGDSLPDPCGQVTILKSRYERQRCGASGWSRVGE